MKEYKDKCFVSFGKLTNYVWAEHLKQIEKWGIQNRTAFEWLAYLTEEVGELAKAVSEMEYRAGNKIQVRKEAIQVATLALKIAEMIDEQEV